MRVKRWASRLEGRVIGADWANGVVGLRDIRVEIATLSTPDGHSGIVISETAVVADRRGGKLSVTYASRSLWRTSTIRPTG
jgi:hypothetical protein